MKNLFELEKSAYTGLTAKKKTRIVSEADVERQVKAVCEKSAYHEAKEGPAELGDVANIDYEGFKDGVPFKGGKGAGFDLGLGTNTFIPGFETQLVGHVAGETVEVKLSFPVGYPEKSLAGQPVVFVVKINSVGKKVVPEMNDEFAKLMGAESAEAFREDVRREMQKRNDQKTNTDLNNQLFRSVASNARLKASEEMIREVAEELLAEFKIRLTLSGQTIERFLQMQRMTMADFEKQMEVQAKSSAHIRGMLVTIAAQENLMPDEEELAKFYEGIARGSRRSEEEIRELFPAELAATNIAMNKAGRYIHEHAVIEEA